MNYLISNIARYRLFISPELKTLLRNKLDFIIAKLAAIQLARSEKINVSFLRLTSY